MRSDRRHHLTGGAESTRRLVLRATTSCLRAAVPAAHEALAVFLVALLALPTASLGAVAPRAARPKLTPTLTAADDSRLSPADAATRARVEAGLGSMPLYFIENRGQIDSRVAYYANGATNSVYFTRTGIVFQLTKRVGGSPDGPRLVRAALAAEPPAAAPAIVQRHAIGLEFEGANPEVRVAGRERTPAVVSYFQGEPSDWKTGLSTYGGVVYEELWPGIDLVYGSETGRPKYSFIVKPGADPDQIRLVYRGASGVRLTESGRLEIETPVGGFGEDRPYAYQEGRRGARAEVEAVFEAAENATTEAYRFGFRVGAYDRTRALVLDPVQFAYCGYLGGAGDDEGWGIAVDTAGNAYVAGYVGTPSTGFPAATGPDVGYNGNGDAYVAKINPSGTALVYCGYIGGIMGDKAFGIAVDGSGSAYVVGLAESTPAQGFPVVGGSWDTTHAGGNWDYFVAKVNAAGTSLLYCGYIGGSGQESGPAAIAVDGAGNAYVTGKTQSTEAQGFPVVAGSWDTTYAGGLVDAFAAKINATGSALDYCGYIGGGGDNDEGWGIAVDTSGNAYVGGRTDSRTTGPASARFPVTPSWPYLSFNGGIFDAFVAKINATGTALVYCGYIGGSGGDNANGIAVDGAGNAYLVGPTNSTQADFPVVGGSWDTTQGGGNDVFVTKVNAAGTGLVYSGFLGGSGNEVGLGIAVDGSGNAYVMGNTSSTELQGFPVGGGPDLDYNGSFTDGFVAKINAAGTALDYCGYIGGSNGDFTYQGGGIAVDTSGNAYVVGQTMSTQAQNFPVTAGSWDAAYAGGTNDAFVAKIGTGILAVELTSFSALSADGAVDLSWETGTELNNLGFHLYRATAEAGPYERITPSLIPGLGTSPAGGRYSWRDGGLANGTTYFYELEDVETTGATKAHGPVRATPRAGAPVAPAPSAPEPPQAAPVPPEPEPPGAPSKPRTSLLTYGDPAQVSLRVTERTPGGLTLELVTGGFYAEALSDGSVRLSVPGFETLSEPGLPSVPVERTMIDALVGRGVRIDSIEAQDVASFPTGRPESAGLPELVVSGDGTVKAGVRAAARRAGPRGAYPAASARLVSVGFQGETKKALLELCPLRWNEPSGRLLLARRLRVRVVFSGVEADEHGRGARGRREAHAPREMKRAARLGLVAQLATRQAGPHAVRFEQLFGQASRTVPASALRLSYQGQAVAFSLAPDPTRFGPGSMLFFLSAGPAANPYGNEAVYELFSGRGGLRMGRGWASPTGASITQALSRREYEENRYYLSNLTTAPDPWLWEYLRSGEAKTVSLPLSRVGSGEGHVEIAFVGVSDYPVSPDHHVRAFLNGALLGEVAWDGRTPARLAAAVPPGVLREGDNALELEDVPDTAASESLVYLDRVSLSYPRALAAEEGGFEAGFALPGQVSVTGLGPGSALLDITSAVPRWLEGAVATPEGLVFHAEAGHRYLAVSPEAILVPEVRPASRSTLRDTAHQADFILVAPSTFLAEAQPLLEHRRAQGLSVMGIAAEELYQQFGHGEARPEALRDFLAYAFHNWTAPAPRYLLLLGDASYDPKGRLGPSPGPLLPTPLLRSSFLWTAADPSLGAVNGEDGLPDVAIGRLPAATVEEARSLIHKTIAWEESGRSLSGPITLVSDNPDTAGDFEQDAETIARTTLASRTVEHISLARLGTSATREAIRNTFDRGSPLVSYVGHGAIMLWASEQLLKPGDVTALAPQGQQPLVLAMNCLNSFFHLPAGDSLSERLVKVEDRGAIASFSSSGMASNEPTHRYHAALLSEIAAESHERLGDAVLAAQARYADTGADPELLALYHLLGDPALKIR